MSKATILHVMKLVNSVLRCVAINELTVHLVDVWLDFRKKILDGAIDEWRKCMKGHYLEYIL